MSITKSKQMWICGIFILAGLIYLGLSQSVNAAECDTLHVQGESGCASGDGWDPMAELDNMGTPNAGVSGSTSPVKWPERSREMRWNQPAYGFNNSSSPSSSSSSSGAQDQAVADKTISVPTVPAKTVPKSSSSAGNGQAPLVRSSSFQKMLAPISNTSGYDVILDISDGVKEYIPGAIHIDYLDFMTNNSTLKSAADLAELLGDAGISSSDSVLIYGECQPCGGGPSAATFAYYVLKYLGHDDVKVLDGGIRDFAASNRALVSTPATRPNATYTVKIRPELLATYEQVKSGKVQLVDARTAKEFGTSNIPGSLNIPYDSVLSGGRIKDEAALKKLFSGLKKDRTVVAYTNTGVKASMVWFALEMLGYDAKLYTWQDWVEHQAQN